MTGFVVNPMPIDLVNPRPRNVKELKKYVIKSIKYDDFERCLLKGEQIYKEQLSFKTTNHGIMTKKQRKLALSREGGKRVTCPDYISTMAKGHYMVG